MSNTYINFARNNVTDLLGKKHRFIAVPILDAFSNKRGCSCRQTRDCKVKGGPYQRVVSGACGPE